MSSLSLPSPRVQGSASAARRMGPAQRQELSLAVLARQHPATRSVTELARHHDVSRQFCYEQADRGQEALQQAFARPDEDRVLFHLPVTPNWIRQFVLAQLLIGHTSDRGILDLARTLLDYDGLSLGTIHNIAQAAVDQARTLNRQQDQRLLGQVRVGAHDEIFQARRPVLVGIDAQHTYCYLLARERHRDAVSWGVHLLELESRGLRLQRTVADAGQGLRAAQAELWSDVPCQGCSMPSGRWASWWASWSVEPWPRWRPSTPWPGGCSVASVTTTGDARGLGDANAPGCWASVWRRPGGSWSEPCPWRRRLPCWGGG